MFSSVLSAFPSAAANHSWATCQLARGQSCAHLQPRHIFPVKAAMARNNKIINSRIIFSIILKCKFNCFSAISEHWPPRNALKLKTRDVKLCHPGITMVTIVEPHHLHGYGYRAGYSLLCHPTMLSDLSRVPGTQ